MNPRISQNLSLGHDFLEQPGNSKNSLLNTTLSVNPKNLDRKTSQDTTNLLLTEYNSGGYNPYYTELKHSPGYNKWDTNNNQLLQTQNPSKHGWLSATNGDMRKTLGDVQPNLLQTEYNQHSSNNSNQWFNTTNPQGIGQRKGSNDFQNLRRGSGGHFGSSHMFDGNSKENRSRGEASLENRLIKRAKGNQELAESFHQNTAQTLGDHEPGSVEGLKIEIKVKDEEINWYKYRIDCLNEENKRQAEQLAKHCGIPTTNSEMLEKLAKLEEENKSWMHKFQARVYDHRLEIEMFSRKQMGYQARELALKYINDDDEATQMLKDAVEQLKKELELVKSSKNDGKLFLYLWSNWL
jgi:hypothetical protein